jgi:hypothetical protein
MGKIIFSLLAAGMLMSFATINSENFLKQQTKQSSNCSFVISGSGSGWASVSVSTGQQSIFINEPFSFVIPVNTSSGTVTATIQTNNFNISVNGAGMVCQDGVTEVYFSEDCVFWGGNCGEQP